MNSEIFEQHVEHIREIIIANEDEWKPRYENYALNILKNIDTIKELKKSFNQWKPLFLYMNVCNAKGSANIFNLRYNGQSVADIKITGDDILLDIGKYQKSNLAYFSVEMSESSKFFWRSSEAAEFRKLFPKQICPGKTPEHALESSFLSELEKTNKEEKEPALCRIQPVKIAGICRFQMPTPLRASEKSKIQYAKKGSGGGGIDILSRVGLGRGTELCIMELKKDAQDPIPVMEQALAYGVFIQELLSCECGTEWSNVFGFAKNPLLSNRGIKVCTVMPATSTAHLDLQMDLDTKRGRIELRQIYLHPAWENGIRVKTSNMLT